jgi:hypothetical protein
MYYPGITRIRPEYKNTRIRIRKMVPNQYPYPVAVSGTLPIFTPILELVEDPVTQGVAAKASVTL